MEISYYIYKRLEDLVSRQLQIFFLEFGHYGSHIQSKTFRWLNDNLKSFLQNAQGKFFSGFRRQPQSEIFVHFYHFWQLFQQLF